MEVASEIKVDKIYKASLWQALAEKKMLEDIAAKKKEKLLKQ